MSKINEVIDEMREYGQMLAPFHAFDAVAIAERLNDWANRLEALATPTDLAPVAAEREAIADRVCNVLDEEQAGWDYGSAPYNRLRDAIADVRRLARPAPPPDLAPVAWQYRYQVADGITDWTPWATCSSEDAMKVMLLRIAKQGFATTESRPLYTHPTPPALSAVEYVEVAELANDWQTRWKCSHVAEPGDKLYVHRALIAPQPVVVTDLEDGPEFHDGCSLDGFIGGCERMGCHRTQRALKALRGVCSAADDGDMEAVRCFAHEAAAALTPGGGS